MLESSAFTAGTRLDTFRIADITKGFKRHVIGMVCQTRKLDQYTFFLSFPNDMTIHVMLFKYFQYLSTKFHQTFILLYFGKFI